MVYEDAEKLYAEVRKDCEALLEEAFGALFPTGSVALAAGTTMNLKAFPPSAEVVGYNTTFFPRSDIVQVPTTFSASQVVQTMDGAKVGYAVMNCAGGGGVGRLIGPEEGLYGQIIPVSGVFSLIRFG